MNELKRHAFIYFILFYFIFIMFMFGLMGWLSVFPYHMLS